MRQASGDSTTTASCGITESGPAGEDDAAEILAVLEATMPGAGDGPAPSGLHVDKVYEVSHVIRGWVWRAVNKGVRFV